MHKTINKHANSPFLGWLGFSGALKLAFFCACIGLLFLFTNCNKQQTYVTKTVTDTVKTSWVYETAPGGFLVNSYVKSCVAYNRVWFFWNTKWYIFWV